MKISLIRRSGAPAMVDVDRCLSYADTLAAASQAAHAFEAALAGNNRKYCGGKTNKIAIFSENSMDWVCALYGIWAAGCAAIPIDAKSSDAELEFILKDSDCDIACVEDSRAERVREIARKIPNSPIVLSISEIFSRGDCSAGKCAECNAVERDSSELGLLVYTSGTTGNPKGVMLTFANMYANMRAVYEAKYYNDGIRVLTMLPFHHILPLMGTVIMPLSINGKLVFPKSISPADMAEVLQKYSVDMIISVPRFYELMHANIMAKIGASKIARALFEVARIIDNKAVSRKIFGAVHKKFGGEVKYWISGGAALDRKVWRDLETLGFCVCEGYGMTECAPIIAFPRIGRVKIGSPGEALPGIEIRIVDGEIVVRGENVTSGYYRRPEDTAEAIRNGWLFTGDLGYLDENGFLFITGRRKEIIVLANGKNLNPAEMEAQIKGYSGDVLECGVLMYENMLQAIIRVPPELMENGQEAAEELIRNTVILPYNRSTAMYKRVIRFRLTTDELPRTRVGKLKRFQLSAYLESLSSIKKDAPARDAPRSDAYESLNKFLKSQVSMPVTPDAHMEMDLGLDSLGKISMQCFVRENYGVEISEKDFDKYPTLRAFSEHVEKTRDSAFEPSNKGVTWADIISQQPYPKLAKPHFLHFLSVAIFKTLSKMAYRVHVSGFENVPENEPVVIAANHQSYIDGILVSLRFSKTQMYKTRFFAKIRKILKGTLIRNFAKRSNVLIMDINDNVCGSIRELAQALRQKERVVIFPEGTRTKDGKISEFKQTFAIIAKEMGARVVPVAIRGAYDAIKAGSTFPSFGADIYVDYLPPVRAKDGESYDAFAGRVQRLVEDKCAEPLPAKA